MRRACALLALMVLLPIGCGKYGSPKRSRPARPPIPAVAPAPAAAPATAPAGATTPDPAEPDDPKQEPTP